MSSIRSVIGAGVLALSLSACASAGLNPRLIATTVPAAPVSALDGLIAHYAQFYEVPESLVRRIIVRESGYNARAHHGPFWGLMQIRYDTARTMGYTGKPSGLLDADTNLRYGVKYLRGAWLVAGGNADRAVRLYAGGYYYDAKAAGMLQAVGLR